MPIDYKRINGPEISEPYHSYFNTKKQTCKELHEKLGTSDFRSGGRKSNDLRKIYMKTGVVTQAKGSAYIELHRTKVIVSVFDPREIPNKTGYSVNGEIYCEFKYAPFSCRKRRLHQPDSEEKEYSVILRRALESVVCRHEFPNFQLDVYALVLENDGSALGAAVTCAGLALAHAGVPMFDLITGVTLGQQGTKLFLDPTSEEEQFCMSSLQQPNQMETDSDCFEHGIILLCMLSTHQQISEMYQTGCFSLDTLTKCVSVLTDANKQIVPLAQKCLVKYVLKHAEGKKKEEENVIKNKDSSI